MSDVTLSDGQELTFDLLKITISEYRSLLDPNGDDKDNDALMGRTCGLTGEQVGQLSQPDWRKFTKAFFAKATEPLADPN